MGTPRHPSLYQINTRVWLTALAQSLGRPAALDASRTPSSTDWPVRASTGSGS